MDNFSMEKEWEHLQKELEKKGCVKRNINELYGERLKDFRSNKKMSIAEAARISGFSTGTISHYENGKSLPTIEDLRVLLSTYGATLYDYFGIEAADYENDCKVFRRYGLSENLCYELFLQKNYKVHQDIVNCINLIFEYPIFASSLFEGLAHFFDVSYHKEIEHIPIQLSNDATARVLLEPVIQTLIDIFNAKYPERRKNAIALLFGQQAEQQAKIQATIFEKTQQKEQKTKQG